MNISIDVSRLVNTAVDDIKAQLHSRAFRAAQELRTAELEVLRGQRSGRRYKTATSGHKMRNGKIGYRYYTASAPGEPPAARSTSGGLRGSFRAVIIDGITPAIETNKIYAPYLEEGTSKMAPRPYKERVIEKAMPGIEAIYAEPFN